MACFVGGAMIWLQKKFEVRDKTLADNNQKVSDALADANRELHERLARMEQRIADLPCDRKDRPCDPL
jgi:hypothetical protein